MMLHGMAMVADTVADLVAAAPKDDVNTDNLANWLRGIFGPLFLVIVGIVAIFFLFTREITRFVQFIVLAIAIGVIFYYPGLIQLIAKGVATALGMDPNDTNGG
ncbi:hypothetical protein GCM10009678_86460 [Actinomadura kijaniata]|uniref:Cation transport ATPase n=1 Tax=Actinomadura namibiensis TaxID=182080 RepID=A0A7W3QSC8_ACTNM|nr:hypothetical protein [Actinomadura namibiensis]MBA8957700.1 cation transport ATPase [Actinomadura namibiensis]